MARFERKDDSYAVDRAVRKYGKAFQPLGVDGIKRSLEGVRTIDLARVPGVTWMPPVTTRAELDSAYPKPLDGWAVFCAEQGAAYVFDGEGWCEYAINPRHEGTAPVGWDEMRGWLAGDG